MRIEISAKGILRIFAETGIERYALEKWCIENIKEDDKIDVNATLFYWGDLEEFVEDE